MNRFKAYPWRLVPQAVALIFLLTLVSIQPLPAYGKEPTAVDRLQDELAGLKSFSADFVQTLYDADSSPLQSSSGSVVLSRPGKFRWQLEAPDNQLIVADGEQLWVYDRDLEQVTVSPITERVAGTPLLLLTSDSPIAEQFRVNARGRAEGLEWFELIPQSTGSDFEALFIGLDNAGIAAMELRDSFGQATQIRFENVRTNPAIDEAQFHFQPPSGVDVIGEPGG